MDGVSILDYINTGIGAASLAFFVVLFLRGDIVPRRVWNDLTKEVVKQTVAELLDHLGIACGDKGD